MREPVALIYYDAETGEDMALDVAARVRNDGGQARPIWAHLFRQPEDMDGEANAVIIQRTLANCEFIAQAYASFSAGVEIHYIDDEGIFVDEAGSAVDYAVEQNDQPNAEQPTPPEADPVVQAEEDQRKGTAEAGDTPAESADDGGDQGVDETGQPAN